MNTSRVTTLALGLGAAIAAGCATYPDAATTRKQAELMIDQAFEATPAFARRLAQDESQKICSKVGGAALTQDEAATVVRLARASMRYPESGVLVGDWKAGDRLAHDGAGDRIRNGKVEGAKQNGGLCQNCHALEPGEVNVGNVGPSLTGYGRQRGNTAEIAKYTYEKIYNAWAVFPCSNMPRLGANGHLTPAQIADLVAFLIDPQSRNNQP